MKDKKLLLWSLTVALGGFLFGLDVAVISGAEQTIQKLWNLSGAMHGLAISIALYGTVIGAAFGGYFADTFGRKRSLFWVGLFFFASAVGSALSNGVYIFMFFRLIGGFSIGASSVIAPLYISEIAPPKKRGFLAGLFQFNIVFGILVAYLSNFLFEKLLHSDDDWRWMLGVVGIPSLIFTFLTTLISESPRWLILKKNDVATARKIFDEIEPGIAEETIEHIVQCKVAAANTQRTSFFSKKYSWLILLAFLQAFFNQLSGINAIIYYAPRVFEMTGLGKSTALLQSTGIGLVNLIFTMIGLSLIDRFGRKALMYIGSFGYIISLGLIALAFYNHSYGGVPVYIFCFIAAHAIGQGAVIWVFIGEIFPNEVRATGQSFGSLTHWIFAAIVANVFPMLTKNFGGAPIFLFFTCMMVLQLLYVIFLMPETKGVALEDMDRKIGH